MVGVVARKVGLNNSFMHEISKQFCMWVYRSLSYCPPSSSHDFVDLDFSMCCYTNVMYLSCVLREMVSVG